MSPEINIPTGKHKKILNKLYDWVLEQKRGSIHFLQQGEIARWINYIMPGGGVIAVEIESSYKDKKRRVYTLHCGEEQAKKLEEAGIVEFPKTAKK